MEQSKKTNLLWGGLWAASYVLAWRCCFNIFFSYGKPTLLACLSSVLFIGIWCIVSVVYRTNKKVLLSCIGLTAFMVLCMLLGYTSIIDYNNILYGALLVGLCTTAPYYGLEYILPEVCVDLVPFLHLIFFGVVFYIHSKKKE